MYYYQQPCCPYLSNVAIYSFVHKEEFLLLEVQKQYFFLPNVILLVSPPIISLIWFRTRIIGNKSLFYTFLGKKVAHNVVTWLASSNYTAAPWLCDHFSGSPVLRAIETLFAGVRDFCFLCLYALCPASIA
jgi:hypothetical protein